MGNDRCPTATCQCDLYGIGENCGKRKRSVDEKDHVAFEKKKYPIPLRPKRPKRGIQALGSQ